MKTKVLHVLGGMGRGGAPSFIINNLLRLNPHEIQFDFLVRKDNCAFNDEIESRGGRIFVVSPFPKNIWKNYKETKKFFQKYGKEYDAIHIHANALYYILPFILAKKAGIKKIILHSHNTQSNVSFLQPIHYLNKFFVSYFANIFLACGKQAGKWMYNDKHFEVINNAVDTQKFSYNETYRKEIRMEFNIPENCVLIGNVGRFQEVKNHSFLIDIFSEFHKKHPESFLLLPGEGTLLNAMKDKAKNLGLSNRIIFPGVRSDIEKIYSALDIFVMPSLYEGLPFVGIEAQCSGLRCILSDHVTEEAFLTDLCTSVSLDENAYQWSCVIENQLEKSIKRESYSKIIRDNDYDINYTAKRLLTIYKQ